jgi:predicted O-methyltransferase YrrM
VNPQAVVERLLADPPRVHPNEPEFGVWRTERACYELIASRCPPKARTLETGLGVSTALFLALGAQHTCVVVSANEVEAIRRYCEQRSIPTDGLRVELGLSEDVLPRLATTGLDVVFIDGGHGFPTPIIDWYYGGGLLRRGGVVVFDDLQLPAVSVMVGYLDADPRWRALSRTAKWAAFERLSEGPLTEDHWAQPFLTPQRPLWKRALGRVKRALT